MLAPLYMQKAARDKAWRDLGKPGRRTSIRRQLLHPQYVADYPDKAASADNGFGNRLYKTFFSVLYTWVD